MIQYRLHLLLYNLATVLYSPWWLKKRKSQWPRRNDKHAEKFALGRWICPIYRGFNTVEVSPSSGGERVVFLGFGYGQMRQIARLSAKLREDRPAVKITWAFSKPDAVRRVQKDFPEQDVTYIPFDFVIPTQRWLKHLAPNVIVVVERAWYPNIIWNARLRKINVVLANGARQSGDVIFNMLPMGVRRSLGSGFSMMCFQEEEHRQEVEKLTSDNVKARVVGNLKFDCQIADDSTRREELAQWLHVTDPRPILAAGSTGPEDEEFVLRAFEITRRQVPCRLMIAPRRLPRIGEVEELIARNGFGCSLRTHPTTGADIFILDTLGELAIAYQFCAGVFIGGTLGGAGHDVVEPLVWGVPVYFGTGGGKIGPGQRECEAAGVGFRVSTPEELAEHWLQLVQSAQLRADLRDKASRLLQEQSGSLARNVAAITELLDG
jgi:3-deoxy-D-manno-octulosonic-acid transferase